MHIGPTIVVIITSCLQRRSATALLDPPWSHFRLCSVSPRNVGSSSTILNDIACVCISFIRTLGTHNKQIIKLHHVTHTHSISADSEIVKSRREISLFRTRSNSFTNCASRVMSTVLHGWCISCLYTWQQFAFLTWISYIFRRMAIFIPIGDWAEMLLLL